MKLALFCLLGMLLPVLGNAGEYNFVGNSEYADGRTNLSEAIRNAWGITPLNDGYIQDADDETGKAFQIKRGWSCCGTTNNGVPTITKQDDVAIMAYVAQKNIAEHGAEFCLTQIHVGSTPDVFSLYYQQPNWPNLQCAWFCEPGWDGVGCKEKTSENHACNPVKNYVAAINKVKESIYTGNDAITLSRKRIGIAENIGIFDAIMVNNFYPHQVVLGAIEFKEHGIVVTPIVLGGVGSHTSITHLTTRKLVSGVKKTLCAQGYTKGENCEVSSKQCGTDILCTGYSDKFNSNIHEKKPNGLCSVFVCKDGDKGLDEDSKCVQCEQSVRQGICAVSGDNVGKCIKCNVGKYFDETDCSCKDARVLDQNQIKYGAFEGDIITKQCWTMNDPTDFKECMLGTTTTKD